MAIIRYNQNAYESGEFYLARLQDEVNRNFTVLLNLLSSYWKSTVDGPNYARSMKAMAIALSQIRLALNDIYDDNQWSNTRGEFIEQVIRSMAFPDGAPNLEKSDVEFRSFLVSVVKLYFKGSVPVAIQGALELLTNSTVVVRECYLEARQPGSGYDISDQFTFEIDVYLANPSAYNVNMSDRNVRILLGVMRPAHTLYKLRNILQDEYTGNIGLQSSPNAVPSSEKILDLDSPSSHAGMYEDYRKFSLGVSGVDQLGAKSAILVSAEMHTI